MKAPSLLCIPYGGPITHSSTGSKPDSPVHPLFPRLFLASGLICNSRATFWDIINSSIRHKTYSYCSGPLVHFVSGIGWLPTRLKLLMVPSYLLSIFSWVPVRELLSTTFPYVSYQIVNLAEVRYSGIPPLLCGKYVGVPEENDDFIMMTWSREMKTAM